MFNVSTLLNHLENESEIEVRKIERILKLTKKQEKKTLEIALSSLNKLGILQVNQQGKVKKIEDTGLVQARLRCSSKGFCFAVRDDGLEDIYIREQFLNHAWNGDRVLVKVVKEAYRRRSPEGSVQCILERVSPSLPCLIRTEEKEIYGIPLDDRILANIQLSDQDRKYYKETQEESLVEVKVEKYPIAQLNAEGTVIRELPLDGDFLNDADIILSKLNISDKIFDHKSSIKTPVAKNRLDLTDQNALILSSWVNKSAPPLPSVKVEASNGGFKIWLHANSLVERLKRGGATDNLIKARSECHCLGKKWINLLPEDIRDVIAFKAGLSNEAITICMTISPKGELEDWQFQLTTIKPVTEINNDHLIALKSRKPRSRIIPAALKPIKDHIDQLKTLIECSTRISDHQKSLGIIELDLEPSKSEVLEDLEKHNPSNEWTQWKQPLDDCDGNSILAPIIRIANQAWACHAKQLNLPSIDITYDHVDISTLNDVAKASLALDLKIELNNDGVTSLPELAEIFAGRPERRILDRMLKNAIPQPKLTYSCNEESNENRHAQDEIPELVIREIVQSPWCCPTLNYTNVINQNVIVSLLREGKERSSTRSKSKINLGDKGASSEISWSILPEETINDLRNLCYSNIRQLDSQSKKSRSLHQGLISISQIRATEPLVGKEVDATITGVQSYGFFAEILSSNSEGLVHVSTLNDDWYEYRSRQNLLVGRKSKRTFQLGDKITVKVISVDILRNQIDLEIINKGLESEIKASDEESQTLDQTTTE